MLVAHYNLIIKEGYYPQRWIKILDAMLNKGNWMILGKLQIITFIKAGMQNTMWICLSNGEIEKIENSSRKII